MIDAFEIVNAIIITLSDALIWFGVGVITVAIINKQ